MQIVIKIPNLDWSKVKNGSMATANLLNAVRNGTVLPKHHGRIIDESKINKVYAHTEETINNNIKVVVTEIIHTDAPTIIEADKEEE